MKNRYKNNAQKIKLRLKCRRNEKTVPVPTYKLYRMQSIKSRVNDFNNLNFQTQRCKLQFGLIPMIIYPYRIQGVKKAPDPRSRIRNTKSNHKMQVRTFYSCFSYEKNTKKCVTFFCSSHIFHFHLPDTPSTAKLGHLKSKKYFRLNFSQNI